MKYSTDSPKLEVTRPDLTTSDPNLIQYLIEQGHQPIGFQGDTVEFEGCEQLWADIASWDEIGERKALRGDRPDV